MEFKDGVRQLAEKALAERQKPNQTEEGTKMALIVPMFNLLGYDVFNTNEFCPEYTADYGVKRGDKVDYAILHEGNPLILIECKPCTEPLNKHIYQLYAYFGATPAKFGILTNGVEYWFYTDLEKPNQMDLTPFLTIDLASISDSQITALSKFRKEAFNKDSLYSVAESLKYSTRITNYLAEEMESVDDKFASFIIKAANAYSGRLTQKVLDQSKALIQRAFSTLINDQVNKKISQALGENNEQEVAAEEPEKNDPEPKSKIITTDEEVEAFYIVRGLLAGTTPVEDIVYRDAQTYFSILYKDNNRHPICRLVLTDKKKLLRIPDENGNFIQYSLESLDDIYKYRNKLIATIKKYIK